MQVLLLGIDGQHFPPLQHKTGQMIEREICEGIDEMCRRHTRKFYPKCLPR